MFLDLFLSILGWRQSDLGIALFHKAVRVAMISFVHGGLYSLQSLKLVEKVKNYC